MYRYLQFIFLRSITVSLVIRDIVERLVKKDVRLAAVHLVDAHYCSDPGKFISGNIFKSKTVKK